MTASFVRTAHVRLCYRPASDVLSGDIDPGMLGAGDAVTHSPDADTHFTWFPVLGDGEVLAGFHVLHASARWQQGVLAALPAPLARLAPHLIERGTAELALRPAPLRRAELRLEASVRVPTAHLTRPSLPSHAPAEWLVTSADVEHTARSLAMLADTVSAQAPHHTEASTLQLLALGATLHELSSVIARSGGRTAPGTAAAARCALVASLPFEPHQRHQLVAALHEVDDVRTWPTMWALVDDLCASLLHSHAVG